MDKYCKTMRTMLAATNSTPGRRPFFVFLFLRLIVSIGAEDLKPTAG